MKRIDHARESPAPGIIELLAQEGAQVGYSDPGGLRLNMDRMALESQPPTAAVLRAYDCTLIVNGQKDLDCDPVARESALVVDCPDAVGVQETNIVKL